MKDTDFIYIPGWAVNRLKLKGNELLVYSIIYSYSRDGIQWYQAPAEYLATCIGASVSTVKDVLKKLTDKGLLQKKTDKYKGSVDRVYYQAIVTENDQYENGTGKSESPVPKRYGYTSTETVLNNTITNNSIIYTGTPKTSRHSLFKKENPETKITLDKVEKFALKCHKISQEYEFSNKVSDKLVDFFRMLGQSGSYLPEITIRAQLSDLVTLNADQQLDAISDTLKSGWKSLKYAIDNQKKLETASFDTAKPGAFQPKDPKNDTRWQDYESDEVF